MISILITHYNRYEALTNCINAFKLIDFENQYIEIVVSDDCSSKGIQKKLKGLGVNQLLLSDTNTGLASNLNRGLKACRGDYILYCQEDFVPKNDLSKYILEAINILDDDRADMCRLKANYRFPKLLDLSPNFKLIPKFSFKNFYYNTFQYSDNPFITKSNFFKDYGYFLDNVSGAYGENEYAIRIMRSKARIAISKTYPFKGAENNESVILPEAQRKKRNFLKKLKIHKLLRAIRLHLEFLFYNKNKRGLITLKNKFNNFFYEKNKEIFKKIQ